MGEVLIFRLLNMRCTANAVGGYSHGLLRLRARLEPMGDCEPYLHLVKRWDLASALVLAVFCMKEMVPLRFIALASSLSLIAYGAELGITPIWLLHILLLVIGISGFAPPLRSSGRRRHPPARLHAARYVADGSRQAEIVALRAVAQSVA